MIGGRSVWPELVGSALMMKVVICCQSVDEPLHSLGIGFGIDPEYLGGTKPVLVV